MYPLLLFVTSLASTKAFPSKSITDTDVGHPKEEPSQELNYPCTTDLFLKSKGISGVEYMVEKIATAEGIHPYKVLLWILQRIMGSQEQQIPAIIGAKRLEELLTTLSELPETSGLPESSYVVPTANKNISSSSTIHEESVVIVPVSPDVPVPLDTKLLSDAPIITSSPSVNNLPHFVPQAKPPPGVTVHLTAIDDVHEITVIVSPLMTVVEALRQANLEFQRRLGKANEEDVLTLGQSSHLDCSIVSSFNGIATEEHTMWKVKVTGRDGQEIYSNVCLPEDKEILVKPGLTISLIYSEIS